MRKILMSALICFSIGMNAQNKPGLPASDKLTPGAALLFKNVKTSLPVAEKNRVFISLDILLAPDKKSFTLGDYPVDTYIYPLDLNGDSREELFVGLGSVAMFGNVGENFILFMKNMAGAYVAQPDIGGGRPLILSARNMGYPDIVIGGPGFEHPLYRWNGRKYTINKKIKDGSLTEANSMEVEIYSKRYTDKK